VCWIIACSSFGAGNAVFSLIFYFYNIRSINRYCAAIAPLGALYFVFVIHRFMRGWAFSARLGVLLLIALFAMLDQTYHHYPYSGYADFSIPNSVINKLVISDKDLVLKLEGRLKQVL